MPLHPVTRYIHAVRTSGMSHEEIMNELTKVGWHAHDLIGVILDAHKTREHAPIISVLNVSKFYGSLKALDRVDLHVPRGSITALLGPNGAGKTTLIRILTTLTPPSGGTATVDGLDVVHDAGRVRAMIGLAGQHRALWRHDDRGWSRR